MDFIPDESNPSNSIPFYDDVSAQDGWQGHATRKTLDELKAEVSTAITRLGGIVTGFQPGQFDVAGLLRDGFRVTYLLLSPDGRTAPGRLDIAALPVRREQRLVRSLANRREGSLKMALYMLRIALDGSWFLQRLSPGYSALLPWLLTADGRTLSDMWGLAGGYLVLPPGSTLNVDGEVID